MLPTLDLDFTAQPPIPQAGIDRANELMASGRLFRYGEAGAEELDVARLEADFAALVGSTYCVALNSCGAALAVALKAAGVEAGDSVMMNAFTLAPVPGAVAHVGAEPLFIGITPDLVIDLDDARRVMEQRRSHFLLLSHMRGHIADLDAVAELALEFDVTVIEDCAHTMGAGWRERPTGSFGAVGCFSTQTFKHVNSGEGGLLVTDDPDIAARAVLLSGSYMLYEQHGAAPETAVFERHRLDVPNFSMRMSALAAAVARPQLALLPERAATWRARHDRIASGLSADPRIVLPERAAAERFVPSSIQFSAPSSTSDELTAWVARAADHGVAVKWFGCEDPVGFTSRFDHWRYAPEQSLASTARVLASLCDMRIPLSMSDEQAGTIVDILLGTLP